MESHGQQIKAKDLGTAYRRYIGLQVSHFGAASMLAKFSEHLAGDPSGTSFTVPVIAIKQIRGRGASWMGITNVLKDLAAGQSPSGEDEDIENRKVKYEQALREIIKTTSGDSPAFKQFRRLIDGGSSKTLHEIKAVVHCEIVLAALLKFGEVLPADMLTDRLRKILVVRSCLVYV
jgi:hypothetical protein